MAWFAGQRVVLRAWEHEDVRAAWEAAQSPEIEGDQMRDWLAPPKSLQEMEQEFDDRLAEGAADAARLVIDVEGRPIGDINLFHINERNRTAHAGMGIWHRADRGKGYGFDALRTLMRWAFMHQNLHRIELSVDPENAAAIRIYEKCGFVLEGRRREQHFDNGAWHDELVMGLLRADFERAGG